jgi:hypothetical protein
MDGHVEASGVGGRNSFNFMEYGLIAGNPVRIASCMVGIASISSNVDSSPEILQKQHFVWWE